MGLRSLEDALILVFMNDGIRNVFAQFKSQKDLFHYE